MLIHRAYLQYHNIQNDVYKALLMDASCCLPSVYVASLLQPVLTNLQSLIDNGNGTLIVDKTLLLIQTTHNASYIYEEMLRRDTHYNIRIVYYDNDDI